MGNRCVGDFATNEGSLERARWIGPFFYPPFGLVGIGMWFESGMGRVEIGRTREVHEGGKKERWGKEGKWRG